MTSGRAKGSFVNVLRSHPDLMIT
uniref:Uncharacterized protein n=1 Tax=Arundo donax TaxID=35708 RepID=A0A0A8Z5X5_ARUDO